MTRNPIGKFANAVYDLVDQRDAIQTNDYVERTLEVVALHRETTAVVVEGERIRFEEISLALLTCLTEISPAEVGLIESQSQSSSDNHRFDRPHQA